MSETVVSRGSVLDTLRARRAEAEKRKHLRLPVPGWQGGLVAKYAVLDPESSRKARRALSSMELDSEDADTQTTMLAEMLAAATVEILARDADDRLVALSDHVGDGIPLPVKYDTRLATAVGVTPARETDGSVVRAVFSDDTGTFNVMAFTNHVTKLIEWMSDTSRAVEGEILEESEQGEA
jgi:hypothetical protein